MWDAPNRSDLDPESRDDVDALLETARRRFREAEEAEAELRRRQREDLEFLDPETHWPPEIRLDRRVDRRPCLTVDRINPFIRQVLNSMRRLRLPIQVVPQDDLADPPTARLLQDLVRHIERRSHAQLAYATAAFHQVALGRGFLRVVSAYTAPDSFDQELRIVRVRNPFAIYLDPNSREPDGSDAEYAFVVDYFSKEAFAARFGQEKLDRITTFAPGAGQNARSWITERGIQVAEYWYLDREDDELLLFEPDPDLPEDLRAAIPSRWLRPIFKSLLPRTPTGEIAAPPGLRLALSRKTQRTSVRWAIISGSDLLVGDATGRRGELWPTRERHRIPIVPVIGEEIDYGGSVDLRGIVRNAKDIQRLYDFHVSAMAEEIALKPKAPYIGYEGQFEGHTDKWNQLNRRAYPYLEVKPMTIGGQVAPLPQRQVVDPAVNAIILGLRQADFDLKAVMGLYEPSLGERRGTASGRAILALQRQGEIGTGHFPDGLALAVQAVGEILVDLIPSIYGPSRILRLMGEDRRSRRVLIHTGSAPAQAPEGLDGIYQVGLGRYDVHIQVGPAPETRRQEIAQRLAELVQAYPAAFPVLGDLLVGSLDWEGAEEAARRLRALLPPQVATTADLPADLPPEATQLIQQLRQQVAALQQHLQVAQEQLRTKRIEQQGRLQIATLEAQTKERIAALEAELALLKLHLDHAKEMAEASESVGTPPAPAVG